MRPTYELVPSRLLPGDQTLEIIEVLLAAPVPGRVPRVARLMALAIKFDTLIRDRVVRLEEDRSLTSDIDAIAELVRSGALGAVS